MWKGDDGWTFAIRVDSVIALTHRTGSLCNRSLWWERARWNELWCDKRNEPMKLYRIRGYRKLNRNNVVSVGKLENNRRCICKFRSCMLSVIGIPRLDLERHTRKLIPMLENYINNLFFIYTHRSTGNNDSRLKEQQRW